MRCPSCSAPLEDDQEQCSQCGISISSKDPTFPVAEVPPNGSASHRDSDPVLEAQVAQSSRLIEFPGVSRNAIPPWRQQLTEKVREVQEKRAREAALENLEKEEHSNGENGSSPQLELLPYVDAPPVNPLVSAALKRIERAHQQAPESFKTPLHVTPLAAVACAGENQLSDSAFANQESSPSVTGVDTFADVIPATTERVRNLVVVRPRANEESEPRRSAPRRMISDDPNDPALNYLDSVRTTLRVDVVKFRHAPAGFRFLGALVDLMVVALLAAPFAGVVVLAGRSWQDWRIIAMGVAVLSVVSFLYFTIATALTGRTLGTRLFSLRIIDARTGLIPTGKQSAGRALVYLASLLTLGVASLYALLDSDKRTAHDRLTGTAVITG